MLGFFCQKLVPLFGVRPADGADDFRTLHQVLDRLDELIAGVFALFGEVSAEESGSADFPALSGAGEVLRSASRLGVDRDDGSWGRAEEPP